MITELDTRDPLDDELRTLDAAAGDLTPETLDRARTLLDSIVGAPDEVRAPVVALRPRPRRWLVLAGAAASLAVGGMFLPGWTQQPAFASWASVPATVPAPVLTAASEACARALLDYGKPRPGVPADQQPVVTGEPRVQLAELRGDYVLVAMATPNGAEISCLSTRADPGTLLSSGGGIPTASTNTAALGPEELRSGGPSYQSSGPDGFAVALGEVGPRVKGVTIRADGRTVQASVADGRFAAWWPTGAVTATSGLDVHYDVTLDDGRVLTDVGSRLLGKAPGAREIGRVTESVGVSDTGATLREVAGLVGTDVVGVTVHSEGKDIVATIANGSFTASWKGAALDGTSGNMEAPEVSYTVTLRDGTVLKNVTPAGR